MVSRSMDCCLGSLCRQLLLFEVVAMVAWPMTPLERKLLEALKPFAELVTELFIEACEDKLHDK